MLTQREQRKAAKNFAEKWEGIGYEKGDSARFWLSLLNEVYGIERPAEYIRFEDRVMLDHTSFIDGFIPSTHVLIEQKSIDKDLRKGIRQSDGSLLSPFQQAKRYSIELPYDDRPRWIVLSNFKEFHIYDMNKPQSEPEVVYLKELETDFYRLNFLIDDEDHYIKKSMEVSIQAGELVGVLYDALLKQYKDPEEESTLKHLNILCVRFVFCFYAEDAGIFGRHNMFHDYLKKFSDNPTSFRDALIKLFTVLNQEEHERDPYHSDELLAFPYVNGGLFEDSDIVIPRINEEIIDVILNKASANFNWASISPTIFGGVFESTLNPETRRLGGMHYTSIENIHKVIDPLFLDELKEEYKDIMNLKTLNTRQKRLKQLQEKMASLKYLDPAAGSGNFLTETYISLRKLENKILRELYGNQIMLGMIHNPIKVSISQFYGIEINDFAVSVARTALWIAESQMMKETEDIVNMNLDFLPLKTYPNIVEGNALKIDWARVIPKQELNYIIGNPPFVGTKYQSPEQKLDLIDLNPNLKKLDYVTGWFYKADKYIKGTRIGVAFVATNSITQGEQVAPLFEAVEFEIDFAYQTFVWQSEASKRASVHCVIIGFSTFYNKRKKYIFDSSGIPNEAENINFYLIDAPNIVIEKTRKPISSNIPEMSKGSQPTDGGYLLLNEEEKVSFVKKYPELSYLIRRYMGAKDFLNNKYRYCFWLKGVEPSQYRHIQEIRERLEGVKQSRLASKKEATRKWADRPYLFTEDRQPNGNYLLVPVVSSQNRRYVPIGYINEEVIANTNAQMIPNASLYHFAILNSNVHNAWMRAICGRMKSDYAYSATIVYNNFPWPSVSDEDSINIAESGRKILEARSLYSNSTLSDLYDELTMPSELREAHQENDKAVMEIYGFNWRKMTESECVAELMKMYQNLITK
ncbi:DNA methyltransferase [Savagea faecisuis]|uniref:site-specific DNA-methyltransferase (adenine-specific) n=1 Tax=Savagea faecisuis TaxID=1274803 RepID=A0ABW3GU15_9BACL